MINWNKVATQVLHRSSVEMARVFPPRGNDHRDFMDVHWDPCGTPTVHMPHWVGTDQAKLVITNCPGRDEQGDMSPSF